MGTLEKVMQMQQQGLPESYIIRNLRNEGASPKDINEALSQSKIKYAINTGEEAPANTQAQGALSNLEYSQEEQNMPSPNVQTSGQATFQGGSMQPSIMQPQIEYSSQVASPPPNQIPSSYQSSTAPYEQQYYGQETQSYPEYAPTQYSDIETISNVAEQIIAEKNSKIQQQISQFERFRSEAELEIKRLDHRLSKIEDSLDELQKAILGKIGEYGSDLKDVAKELKATQDSFSKIIEPLAEHAEKKHHHHAKK